MAGSGEGTRGSEQRDLNLLDFGRIVWQRKVVIVLVVVTVVAVAFGLSARAARVYQGSASLLLTPSLSQALDAAGGSTSALGAVDAATAVKVIESHMTATAAAGLLKVASVPSASATQAGSTDVVTITVQSTDPVFAAKVANGYANAYIMNQRTDTIDSLTAASTQISDRIGALDGQVSNVQSQINTITSQEPTSQTSSKPGAAEPTPSQAAQLASLNLQQTSLNDQETAMKQDLGQVQLAANLAGGGGQLVDPAEPNRVPVSPKTSRNLVLALGIGAALGLGLALLLEVLDNRIRGKEDLEATAKGLPVIGMIPVSSEWRDASTPIVVSIDAPESRTAESYRSLRASIQFIGIDQPLHTVQVTSPASSEGKTTTLVNLAIALARAGKQVVVVDCDLRRPRVHQFFDLPAEPGLTSVLLGDLPLLATLKQVEGVDGLRVLTSGSTPPNPSELLSGQRALEIFDTLRSSCDIVLVDSPPVLPVSDGVVIASRVDATVIVVDDRRTRRRELVGALELLHQVDAHLIGTVLNRIVTTKTSYRSAYYYRPYVATAPSANGNENGKANGTPQEAPDKDVGVTDEGVSKG